MANTASSSISYQTTNDPCVREEVYSRLQDSAGNWHWTGTMTGTHVLFKEGRVYKKEEKEFYVKK